MLRPDSSQIDPEYEEQSQPDRPLPSGSRGLDVQQELNHLEEMILDSPRIPLTRRTLVDEEQLLDQLDLVRLNLPEAFREAEAIIYHKEEIFLQAEQYAKEIVKEAERQADKILDELGIIRRAEQEAAAIRQRVQEECQDIQQQTLAEIAQVRLEAQQEIEQMRQAAIEECEDIQNGADDYADRVLNSIEQQLQEMLKIIRNGRTQLLEDSPLSPSPKTDTNATSGRTSVNPQKK